MRHGEYFWNDSCHRLGLGVIQFQSWGEELVAVNERKFFPTQKLWDMNYSKATPFQNGDVKKQGQNGGTWLAANFMQTNSLIVQLRNVLLLLQKLDNAA